MNISIFWESIIQQNESLLRSFFHKDAIIRWHCTNELFSVEEYIRANCDYPGIWQGRIERIEKLENLVILIGQVSPIDNSSSNHVVTFLKLKDNLIIEMDEYWSNDAPPPEWRQKMKIGKKIS